MFTIALLLAHPAIDPGLATFYERTVESQLDRDSPFSIWGQVDGVDAVQRFVLIGAAILAIVVAFKPGQRTTAQVAALAAAVVIASQLAVDHWFYLYIPWFCGLVFVALAMGSDKVPFGDKARRGAEMRLRGAGVVAGLTMLLAAAPASAEVLGEKGGLIYVKQQGVLPQGPGTQAAEATAQCPDGAEHVGGGTTVTGNPTGTAISTSGPTSSDEWDSSGWHTGINSTDETITAWLICTEKVGEDLDRGGDRGSFRCAGRGKRDSAMRRGPRYQRRSSHPRAHCGLVARTRPMAWIRATRTRPRMTGGPPGSTTSTARART